MNRLTEKDKQGNWQLKGLPWRCLHIGEIITTTAHDRLYGALCRLMMYEDTGLSPEQIEQMDELYREKCSEVARLKDRLAHAEDQWSIWSEAYQKDMRAWIPVEEQLPENDDYVLMSFDNFSLLLVGRYESDEDGSGAWYLGDCDEDDTCVSNDLFVNAWMPLPKPYGED